MNHAILGYLLLSFMGFVLGLLGGGGSILAVPILVYVIGLDAVKGTAYSLFLVGIGALVGGIRYAKRSKVHFPSVFVFGMPALMGVFSVRKWLIPTLPEVIFSTDYLVLHKGTLIMVSFAIIMVLASFSMIRSSMRAQTESDEEHPPHYNYPLIFLEGIIIGGITGFVGAGGGFLIVPALVLLARLPMKYAVGTSLFIIAIKSLIGFVGDMIEHSIDWGFLAVASALVIIGIFAGTYTAHFISARRLKAIFGVFVLLMGAFIMLYEVYLK